MSEDDVLKHLSDELRCDPTNEPLKRMLRHRLRLLSSRGDRPRPPVRQLDKVLECLLADRLLDAPDGQRPPSSLPLDEEVSQLIAAEVIKNPAEKDAYWTA